MAHLRSRALALPFLAAAAAGAALTSAGPTVAAPVLTAAAPVQDAELDAFRVEFDKAAQLGNKALMDGIMRKQKDVAVRMIVFTAERMAEAPNEVLAQRYAAMSASWTRAFDSDFPQKLELFFGRLPETVKSQRKTLRTKFDEAVREYADLMGKKDAAALLVNADKMHEIAAGFESLGDKYHASQAFLFEGVARSQDVQGEDADLHKVSDAYGAMVRLREEWELKDTYYNQTKPTAEALRGRGYGKDAAAAGEAPGAAPKSAGEVLTVPLEFEVFDALKDLDRPSYYLDEHRQIWPQVSLKGTGSKTKINRFDDGPLVIRESSAKVMVDEDGDGKGDVEWPTRGKFEVLTVDVGSGASKRKWAVLTEVGRTDDYYQGNQMNLGATDDSFNVYFIPAGAMVGEINGERVQFIDDDVNGTYGSWPQSWGSLGLAEGVFGPEMDSMRVGKEKKARPFSEFAKIGDQWFKLEMQDGGTKLLATPQDLKTGTVSLKGKGLKPDFFVLKGKGEGLDNTYVDVSDGKKVEIPAGRYELYWGMVSKGKGMQRMKAMILPGSESPTYEVPVDGDLTIEYGKPYGFDFTYDDRDGKVTVTGKSVRIVGAGGEAYDRFYGCVPEVVAGVRKAGAKRATSEVTMRPVTSNQGVAEHGWAAMWKPIDGVLDAPGEDVEVQLTQKKNKLFGKLESDWK